MSLKAVTEEPHHRYSSFRVRSKVFVTIPPEEEVIHIFVDEAAREEALAMLPEFIEKLLWGGKVVGLRVTLASAEATVVKGLLTKAYETRVARDASAKPAASSARKPGQ